MRKMILIAIAVVAIAGCKKKETPAQQNPVARGTQPTTTHGYSTAGTAAAPQTPSTAAGTEVGAVMPDYQATYLDGTTFDVKAERGNVVLLNLWATWCGPCVYEIPELQKMHDEHGAQGFKVVGVSLDDTGADVVKNFVSERKMTYPVAIDPRGQLAALFQTSVIPTSVVIDRNGTIVWKKFGLIEARDPELAAALEKALAQKRS